ncbi:MAG: response regulator [Bdellovibrionota bacterium]
MKRTILIAEDRDEIREALKARLTRMGCEVLAVKSGNEAFELVKTKKIDLIISDIRMPEGTGIQLLRRLRRLKAAQTSVPPVIIMTALLEKGESYLKKLGACEVFTKPFDIEHLVKKAFLHIEGRSE